MQREGRDAAVERLDKAIAEATRQPKAIRKA
jgi:hypothetical protein